MSDKDILLKWLVNKESLKAMEVAIYDKEFCTVN